MIHISKKKKLFDIPDKRKNHKQPTPLLGGVAVYLATTITTIISIVIFAGALNLQIVISFLVGITGVTIMGLIDDIITLGPKRRLVVLFTLAIIVLAGCLQFYFGNRFENNNWVVIVITSAFILFWIVAVTNSINFIDGIDGLASCLTLISVAAFAIVFHTQGRSELALPTALALFGAILGFLPDNASPARIFLGDAGSMFIGFMLGILSIMSMSQQGFIFCIVPIYFILVPIIDLCVSVLRRLLTRHSIIEPDNQHIHHILNARFKSQWIVVIIMSLAQIVFAGIGILIYFTKAYLIGWIGLGVLATVTCFLTCRSVSINRGKEKQDS